MPTGLLRLAKADSRSVQRSTLWILIGGPSLAGVAVLLPFISERA